MTSRRRFLEYAAVAAGVAGAAGLGGLLAALMATPRPGAPLPEAAVTETLPVPTKPAEPLAEARFRVEVVARNLEVPWALDFDRDGNLYFTERPGRLWVLTREGRPRKVAELPVAALGEAGLLGLTLHPSFEEEPYAYVYYTRRGENGALRNRISRLLVRGGEAVREEVVFDGIPGASLHDGGRLKFGPDGKLYATTGDALTPEDSQRLDSLAGKVLRLNPDGSAPRDNPFDGSPILSYGHRNPQGLAWHPKTGRLFITEHGPVGDDEINAITPGANYGWPLVSGYGGRAEFVEPLLVFTPAVAPAGAAFYGGSLFPEWFGDLFFAALRGRHLRRVVFDAEAGVVLGHHALIGGEYGRLRDVAVGPEGALYFATSNRDGRGSPAPDDDRILRVVRN